MKELVFPEPHCAMPRIHGHPRAPTFHHHTNPRDEQKSIFMSLMNNMRLKEVIGTQVCFQSCPFHDSYMSGRVMGRLVAILRRWGEISLPNPTASALHLISPALSPPRGSVQAPDQRRVGWVNQNDLSHLIFHMPCLRDR